MVFFCIQADSPYSLFSPALAEAFTKIGRPARFVPLGNRSLFKLEKRLPFKPIRHSLVALANLKFGTKSLLSAVGPNDIVVFYEMFGLVSRWFDGRFHERIKRRGAKLVCIIQDGWPVLNSPEHVKGCDIRVRLADLTAGVTPNLVDLLRQRYPQKQISLMEEAIDTDSYRPDLTKDNRTIVWSGPPEKQKEVLDSLPVLESVFRKESFRLRVVSGRVKPEFKTIVPVEWIPFSEQPAKQFSGASIAFARYADTPYDRCKGNYKIKTYLAAGCAVVSNPVGYNHELIKPGVNGLFANTPDEWETAFFRLLRNPEERLAMRKASRELAIRRFSYEAIAKQYADVLSPFLDARQ